MMDSELAEYLASRDIRRMSSADLVTELEFARRELADPATKGEYRDYQRQRTTVLSREMQRRQCLGLPLGGNSLSPEFIRDLKQRLDIRDIFNYLLGILVVPSGSRRGKYTCPAHPDRHPSGVIYVAEQTYHCFQCGAHGDALDALMAFRGMTFRQAVGAIAGYLGVEMPRPKTARREYVLL